MNKKQRIKMKSSELLPKNNFWVGLGSIFNIGGRYFEYNKSNSATEADTKALRSDWNNVGKDIKKSECDFKSENKDVLAF